MRRNHGADAGAVAGAVAGQALGMRTGDIYVTESGDARSGARLVPGGRGPERRSRETEQGGGIYYALRWFAKEPDQAGHAGQARAVLTTAPTEVPAPLHKPTMRTDSLHTALCHLPPPPPAPAIHTAAATISHTLPPLSSSTPPPPPLTLPCPPPPSSSHTQARRSR
jgi:hypothetical protein